MARTQSIPPSPTPTAIAGGTVGRPSVPPAPASPGLSASGSGAAASSAAVPGAAGSAAAVSGAAAPSPLASNPTARKDAGAKEPTVGYDVPRPGAEAPRASHTSVRPPPPPADAADRWSSTLSGVASPALPSSTGAEPGATLATAPFAPAADVPSRASAPNAPVTQAPSTAASDASPPSGDAPAPRARELDPLASALGSGIRAASQRMLDAAADSLESRLPEAPSLLGADALDAVARRLSAESELWRRMALRAQDRIATAERIGYGIGAVALLACLGLGVVAAFGGLFAGESAAAKALLIVGGAASVAMGALLGYAFTHGVRSRQSVVINAAMSRADRADAELRRLGVAAALRGVDAGAYRDALLRTLDDDARR